MFQAIDGLRWKEQVVVLGSKLSQHNQLAKLGIPLGGKSADAFSCSGNLPVHFNLLEHICYLNCIWDDLITTQDSLTIVLRYYRKSKTVLVV